MQSSYSLLFVELGLSFHPLQAPYKQFEQLATHSWMKMLWEKLSRFNVKAVVANVNLAFPREGDEFIMQVLMRNGYTNEALRRLNRVRVGQQLLFMSDVLTASGNKINPEVLSRRPPGEAWSNMTWPNEHPTDSDFQMWHRAMLSICPSRRGGTRVGRFIGPTHRIWRWTWNMEDSTLHHLRADGVTEEVFASSRKPNRFHHLRCQPASHLRTICSVEPTLGGEGWHLTSSEPLVRPYQAPTSFLNILRSWGNTWLWEHLQVSGENHGYMNPLPMIHWWRSRTGHISGRYTQTCAPPCLSWNAPRGEGVSWGPFQKRYRWQTHTGGNFSAYWPYT